MKTTNMTLTELLDSNNLCVCTQALVRALWHRDIYTHLHSERVTNLSELLGKACDLEEHEIDLLKISACFHDLGKVGTPDEILLKPGKLNEEEWEAIKLHSENGEDIVKRLHLDNNELIAKAIRHHHEHFQGSGYPDQLSGEDIPLFSRIISVADSYDAMSMTRSYHKARSHKEVMKILLEEKGKKSDPYIFNKFEQIIETSDYKVD